MSSDAVPSPPRLPTREATRGRKPRQRALTRDAIVDAALAIVDRDGLDGLTMRSLAHLLDTGAASLYGHVGSKEGLIELLVERVIGEVQLPGEPDPERWIEQLKQVGRNMRRVFASHGDLARASFARIPLGENALSKSEWLLAVMRAGGLTDQVAAFACDLLPMYVMAHAYEDSLYVREGVTEDDVVAFIGRMRDYFSGLPRDRFPNVVALADPLTAGDDDSRFEFGLEVLIRGLIAASQAALPPALD